MEIQCLTWDGYDHQDNGKFYVYTFGRTEKGESVSVKFPFKPFFYVGMTVNKPDITHKVILRRLCGTVFGLSPTKQGQCYKHVNSYCKCDDVDEVPKEWNDYNVWGVNRFSKHSAINLWGFNEGNNIPLIKVECETKRQFYYCIKKIKEYDETFQLFETNIDPILRVLHQSNCSSTGWMKVPYVPANIRETTCDFEIELAGWKLLTPLDRQDIAPFRLGSFDIECFSESGAFPQPTKKEDLVFQIALSRQDYGREGTMVQGLSLDPCLDENTKTFKTERDLLMGFRDLVIEWDLDIITGWNVFGFDFEYIMKRYENDKAFMDKFRHFGRFLDDRGKSKLTEKVLSSSAMGDNKMNILPMSGRFVFDMMQHVKREMIMDSYSLNNVSKTLLNDTKLDMPPSEIFDRWRRQDAEELGEVSKYCIKDTELPLKIMEKLKTVPNLIEMAKATWVPLVYLTERGQQIKVFSLMIKTATENGYYIPTRNSNDLSDEEYQGATVLEPIKGAYYEPIVALDFASLYPSIMRAHNLCYSTYVFDNSTVDKNVYDYEEFEIQGQKHYFVSNRKGKDEKVFALLPKILKDLKEFRAKAKRDMARTRGTPLEEIFNGKQLAYKVVMNSVYGFTGVSKGMLGLKIIASAVTARGRQMIDETKQTVESNFDCSTVVYGDSVSGDTPLLLRKDGKIVLEVIENLGVLWSNAHGGKESCELTGWETWTKEGWKRVSRVIRHPLHSSKRMVKIVTNAGTVVCTDDHSLIRSSGETVSPRDIKVGDVLMTSLPELGEHDSTITNNLASIMGLYMARGRYEDADDKSEPYKSLRDMFYYKNNKIVPMEILNSNRDVRKSFLDGFMEDGDQQDSPISALSKFLLKGKEERDMGRVESTETLPWESQYVYDLTTENHQFQAGTGALIVHNTDSVMVKFNLPDTLTTEEKIAESWKLGERAAEMCKFPYPNELELEKVYCPYILYSKKRYAAKMWVQNKQGAMELEKIDIKGLQVVRRDQTPFARRCGKKVLDILLESNDSKPALDYAMKMGKLLLDGDVSNEDLLETRSLKDDGFRTNLGTDPGVYEAYNERVADSRKIKVYEKRNLPHVWVRDKMWDRKPGSEPRQGERVSFLVTDTGNPKHKLFEKADDPVFVKENNVKLDYLHYFNKLKKPINDLIAPVVGEGSDPLEALIPKIVSLDQCTTKEQVDKFSVKDLRDWCSARISLPKGISKWKKPDWVHQACVIMKINKTTPLEIAFSFSKF